MSFSAIVNVPGYLPMADELSLYETPAAAWGYLADEREHSEDYGPGDGSYSETTQLLRQFADNPFAHVGSYLNSDGTGAIHGPTPDYDGNHDLGLVYEVALSEEEVPE